MGMFWSASKGIEALHLVFMLFVLIIVTFVIIRMVTQYLTPKPVLEHLEHWSEVAKYREAKASCEMVCEAYTRSYGVMEAIEFCTTKARVDLNRNGKVEERYVGGLVAGVPYCEDGIYCFHIYPECGAGMQRLNAETCLRMACHYYQEYVGYDAETAMKVINSTIYWGTCDPEVVKNPATEKDASSWWYEAGYASENCEKIVTGVTPEEEVVEEVPGLPTE